MKNHNIIKIPIGLAGASIGMGMVGSALGSTGLTEGASAMGKWIAPAININMADYTIKQLKGMGGKK